jgi:hypothetical protein
MVRAPAARQPADHLIGADSYLAVSPCKRLLDDGVADRPPLAIALAIEGNRRGGMTLFSFEQVPACFEPSGSV